MSIYVDIFIRLITYTFSEVFFVIYDPCKIGKTIRKLRKERGLSQDVLSGLAGIGRTHLTMIETGTKAANMETLGKISGALNMKLSELVIQYEVDCEDTEDVSS